MDRRLAIVGIVGAVVIAAWAIPNERPSNHVSDHQKELNAANNLAAICTLKPEKC